MYVNPAGRHARPNPPKPARKRRKRRLSAAKPRRNRSTAVRRRNANFRVVEGMRPYSVIHKDAADLGHSRRLAQIKAEEPELYKAIMAARRKKSAAKARRAKARKAFLAKKAAASVKKKSGRKRRSASKAAARANPRRRRRKSFRRRNAAVQMYTAPRKRRLKSRKSYRRRNPVRIYARKGAMRRRNARRRRARGRRRNPAMADVLSLFKQVAAPALALYGSRALSGKLADKIPGFNQIPVKAQGPVMATGIAVLGWFLSKRVKMLQPHKTGIMIGLGLNLLDRIVGALAPESVKSMIGVAGSEDMYRRALAEYVTVGNNPMSEYVSVGAAPPIDDDIALSDYIEVGELEQDLGALEQELGLEQDLGVLEQELGADEQQKALGPMGERWLGGLRASAMEAPVPTEKFLAPIPARSFTGPVKKFGVRFDDNDMLYTGIFSGGGYAYRS